MKIDEAGIHLKTQKKNSKIHQKKVKGNSKDKIRNSSYPKTYKRAMVQSVSLKILSGNPKGQNYFHKNTTICLPFMLC